MKAWAAVRVREQAKLSRRARGASSLALVGSEITCPLIAGPFEPLTGASTKRPPLAVTAAPIATHVDTSTVDMSTYALPGLIPSTIPVGPRATARAASGSDTIPKVMSTALTTSAAVGAVVAPADTRGPHLEASRFHTTTE